MIVRGTAQWAHVFEKSTMSNKYQVDVCNLDKKTVKALTDLGIDVKKGEGDKSDKGNFIIAKAANYPPVVKDRQGNPMDGTVLIGNGSKIKVSLQPYDWTFKGKSGVGAGLNGLMVTSLVQWGGADELEPEEDDDDIGEESDEL
tara:strand:- start:88 stop:519 length:432 start_codon:yes stop_codon:yes gene_type:complete